MKNPALRWKKDGGFYVAEPNEDVLYEILPLKTFWGKKYEVRVVNRAGKRVGSPTRHESLADAKEHAASHYASRRKKTRRKKKKRNSGGPVNNPEPQMSVAGNPRHRKRNKKTGRFVSKKRKRRKNSLGTSAMEYMKSGQGIHRTKNSAVRAFDPKPMSKLQLQIGRNNPIDEDAAYELKIFIDNDADLYRQRYLPIVKNLTRKKAAGNYSRPLATKGFMYLVDDGAKKYHGESGGGGRWHDMFPKPVRERVAEELRDEFEVESSLGNWDQYIPKKYRKKNPLNKTNVRWKGKHKGPRKVRKASPQWWKISSYRANGRVVGHHIGQGTVRQAKEEAAKVSETRGIHRVVLTGPFKQKPMQRKKKR